MRRRSEAAGPASARTKPRPVPGADPRRRPVHLRRLPLQVQGRGSAPPRACRRPHRQLPNAEGWRGPPSPSEGPASQEASRSLLHRRGPRTEAASTRRNAVLDAHLGSTHHRLWGHLRDRPQGSRAVGTRVVTAPAQPPAIRGNTTQPTQGTETTN